MILRRPVLLGVLLAATAVLASTAQASGYALKIVSRSVGSPTAVVPAADGGVWAVSRHGLIVGVTHLDATGRVVARVPGYFGGVAPAHGGGVWVYRRDPGAFLHIGGDGAVLATVPYDVHYAETFMAAGSDGRPWMLAGATPSGGPRRLVRVNAAGAVRQVAAIPDALGGPLVLGADGRMWMAAKEPRGLGFAAVSSSGVITRYRTSSRGGSEQVLGLTRASHGRIAMVTTNSRALLATTRGKVTQLSGGVPGANSVFGEYGTPAVDRAGHLWISISLGDLAEVSPTGRVTIHKRDWQVAPKLAGVAADSRGRIWVAGAAGQVLRVVSGPVCQLPNVLYTRESVARRALARAGCRARAVSGPAGGLGPVRVVGQSVKADRVVAAGTRVNLTIAPTPNKCLYDPSRWTTVASSPDAVLETRHTTDSTLDRTYVSGCLQADGKRWTIDAWADDDESGTTVNRFTLAGHWVAYAVHSGGHYFDATDVRIADLQAQSARTIPVGSSEDQSPLVSPTSLALNGVGTAAWTSTTFSYGPADPCDAVHVAVAGGPDRTLATSPTCTALTDVSIDATTVHWKENGAARSAPID